MILTDDPALADKLRSLRNLCFQPGRRFIHESAGFNFRLTNLQAAIGLAQLQRMGEIVSRKRSMGKQYTEHLRRIPLLRLPPEASWARNVYWMYGIVLDKESGITGAECARRLLELGIETRPFFLGMHEQPVFLNRGLFAGEQYPVAETLARQGLYLPSGLALTTEQMTQVCDAVHMVLT
jgi:perosamine synthetase